MKYIFIFLLLVSSICYGQTTYFIQADTVRFRKNIGNSEFVLENATRTTVGPLISIGNGRTRFARGVDSIYVTEGDSLLVVRYYGNVLDTVGSLALGSGGVGGGANNFTTSISFTDNRLSLARSGLSTLTADFDTTRWHTKLYYDTQYAPFGAGSQTLQQVLTTGSTLTTTNTIAQGTNQLTFTNSLTSNTTGAVHFNGSGSNGLTMKITSNGRGLFVDGASGGQTPIEVDVKSSGFGIRSNALTDGIPFYGNVNPSSTNSAVTTLQLSRFSSGTPAIGIANQIDLYLENSSGSATIANRLRSVFTNVTSGSTRSEFDIIGVSAGAERRHMNIQYDGIVRVNNDVDTLSTRAYARSVGGASKFGLAGQDDTENSTARQFALNNSNLFEIVNNGTGGNQTLSLDWQDAAPRTSLLTSYGSLGGGYVNYLNTTNDPGPDTQQIVGVYGKRSSIYLTSYSGLSNTVSNLDILFTNSNDRTSGIKFIRDSIVINTSLGYLLVDSLRAGVGTKSLRYDPSTRQITIADTTAGGGGSLTISSLNDTTALFTVGADIPDTLRVSLANGDKGDIIVNNGWTNWTLDNGILVTHFADGSVTNAEFQYINTLTSNAQTQLDSKQANIQFKDEGTNIGTSGGATSVNFTGEGVTASHSAGAITVNIATGGSNRYFPFQVGVTPGAADAGDSYFLVPSDYASMRLFFHREGESQVDTTNGIVNYQYLQHIDTIFVFPNLADSERVQVFAYPSSNWTTDTVPVPFSYDADAVTFFTAQGVTSPTDKGYINDLVLALKAGANSWGKTKAIYVAYGTGLVNLKSPGTYDATATNAPTVNASGYVFDGTNDALNTNLVPGTDLSSGAEFHAFYVKASTDDKPVAGSLDAGNGTYIFPRSSGNFVFRLQTGGDIDFGANASAVGTYVVARRGGAPLVRVTKNGTQINVSGTSPTTLSTYPIYIGALNNTGTIGSFNSCTLGIYVIGIDLSDTQMSELSTAISNFITATGRN